jgi:hypothetical protein
MTVLFGRWTFHIEIKVFHQSQKSQKKLGKGNKRSFLGWRSIGNHPQIILLLSNYHSQTLTWRRNDDENKKDC